MPYLRNTPIIGNATKKLGHCHLKKITGRDIRWSVPILRIMALLQGRNLMHPMKWYVVPMCQTENPARPFSVLNADSNLHAQEQQQYPGANPLSEYICVDVPFGGVHPDADIDGVSAAEVAAYVRREFPTITCPALRLLLTKLVPSVELVGLLFSISSISSIEKCIFWAPCLWRYMWLALFLHLGCKGICPVLCDRSNNEFNLFYPESTSLNMWYIIHELFFRYEYFVWYVRHRGLTNIFAIRKIKKIKVEKADQP